MTVLDPTLEELSIIPEDKLEELKKEHVFTAYQMLLTPQKALEKCFEKEEAKKLLSILQTKVKGVYRVTDKSITPPRTKISTSLKTLDSILNNGITSAEITEICSEQRYPRTLLCYNIILKLIQEHIDAKVLYNDPYGMFRPEGLIKLGNLYGLKAEHIINKIFIFHPYTVDQQFDVFKIYGNVFERHHPCMIVVDGIGDFFRLAAKKRSIIYNRIKALEGFILKLKYIVAKDNIYAILLNNTVKKFDTETFLPEFDTIIGPYIETKILLQRIDLTNWNAKVIKNRKTEVLQFSLTTYGAGDTI
ncbi:MAG: hypothetical protein QXJ17_01800 [Nitrososphaeria archaeon]